MNNACECKMGEDVEPRSEIREEDGMKWCIFVNRRCHGEDCVGWIKENCFVYLLLPVADSDTQMQTELDWSKYEPSTITDEDSSQRNDQQLTFFDELERLIIQKHSEHKNL